jgi:hypothetical protein
MYLLDGIKTGRIVVLDAKGNPISLTAQRINKMTMGQLKDTFLQIKVKNLADSNIAKVLATLNPDRVRQTHHSSRPETEAKLRKNVGQHMWSVVAVLNLVLGIP